MKNGIKFLICVIYLSAGILIGIIFKSSFNSIDIITYILIGSNVVMIFLMLLTILSMQKSTRDHISTVEITSRDRINAVEKASKEQIDTMKRWSDIKRKQLLKSLIKEFKSNILIYKELVEIVKNKNYSQMFNNFIYVSLEKCLSNSPIDDDKINHNLLVLYYLIKVHDNKIQATRTANITNDSLKSLIGTIVKDYEKNRDVINSTIKALEKYEQNIKV